MEYSIENTVMEYSVGNIVMEYAVIEYTVTLYSETLSQLLIL